MPLYLVKADKHDYDQFDEMLVYEISKTDAERVALEYTEGTVFFPEEKQVWTATKLEEHELKYGVILASFNAG